MSHKRSLLLRALVPAAMLAVAVFAHAGDAPVVANGAVPADGVYTMQMEELWRAGGADDEVNLFGAISQVLGDAEGNIYLLDSQLSQVHVMGPDGTPLRSLSREGDGPGEIRRPNDMFFLPDGSLGLLQIFPGRIVKVDLAGDPAGNFPFDSGNPAGGGFAVLVRGMCRDDHLVLTGIRQTFAAGQLTQNRFLAAFDMDGNQGAVYDQSESLMDFANPTLDEVSTDFSWGRFDIGPGGLVALAPARDAYSIQVRDREGAVLMTVTRDYEHRVRNETDLARTRAFFEAQGRNYPVPPKITIDSNDPDIFSLRYRDDGELWVLPSQGRQDQPEGILVTYDVFDTKGRFVNQAAVSCPGDGTEDQLFPVGNDVWVLVRNLTSAALSAAGGGGDEDGEEAEPMEVVCYRAKP